MALAAVLTGTAEGYVLVYQAVVADDGGFADDDAHAVIDEQSLADGRAGMDLYAGFMPRALAEIAGDQLHIVLIKPVRAPMLAHRLVAGIEKEYLQLIPCGGIAVHRRLQVCFDCFKHSITLILLSLRGASAPRQSHKKGLSKQYCRQGDSHVTDGSAPRNDREKATPPKGTTSPWFHPNSALYPLQCPYCP